MRNNLEEFWSAYSSTLPGSESPPAPYETRQFGDLPGLADELGRLIVVGMKAATCSCLWEWEANETAVPAVGKRHIVLDGSEAPLCIIETTEVNIRPFRDVDESIAYDEGEGDRSLEYWRRVHWEYFCRVLPKIGEVPTLDIPLVCERFQMIYKPPG